MKTKKFGSFVVQGSGDRVLCCVTHHEDARFALENGSWTYSFNENFIDTERLDWEAWLRDGEERAEFIAACEEMISRSNRLKFLPSDWKELADIEKHLAAECKEIEKTLKSKAYLLNKVAALRTKMKSAK